MTPSILFIFISSVSIVICWIFNLPRVPKHGRYLNFLSHNNGFNKKSGLTGITFCYIPHEWTVLFARSDWPPKLTRNIGRHITALNGQTLGFPKSQKLTTFKVCLTLSPRESTYVLVKSLLVHNWPKITKIFLYRSTHWKHLILNPPPLPIHDIVRPPWKFWNFFLQ